MTYENYAACATPKDLLIVPGADHGMSYFMEPEKYENAVKAFWAKNDRLPDNVKKFAIFFIKLKCSEIHIDAYKKCSPAGEVNLRPGGCRR